MQPFRYETAATPQDAVRELREPGASAIAGGTELLNWMRLGIIAPAALVDVGRMRGEDRIERRGEALRIGALATLNAVGENALVQRQAAVLSQACLKAASAQVRNRATLGGNILQKTRCAYFRSEAPLPWGCNKREPGSGCAARHGLNERHAIFGWTEACVATHPADPAVALACLDAEVELLGPDGRRSLAMTDFLVTQAEAATETPGLPSAAHAAQVESRLRPGELITGYLIPIHAGERSAYVKVRERESYEYALVSAAATVEADGGLIRRARLALGSVAQKPWRLRNLEAVLVGTRLDRRSLAPPIRAALSEARPLEHNRYKLDMAAGAALRALMTAGGQA